LKSIRSEPGGGVGKGVPVEVAVGVGVGVAAAVAVGVGATVGPGVGVGAGVAAAVGVGVAVAVGAAVGVAAGVGVGVGPASALIAQRAIALAEAMASRCRIIKILEREEMERAMDKLHLRGGKRRTVIERRLSHHRGDLVKILPRESRAESPANPCVSPSRVSSYWRELPLASQEGALFRQGC
jgi:hypothetical protein